MSSPRQFDLLITERDMTALYAPGVCNPARNSSLITGTVTTQYSPQAVVKMPDDTVAQAAPRVIDVFTLIHSLYIQDKAKRKGT